VAAADALKAAGATAVVCVSVNDPFVMAEWGKAHKADGKVRMLADTTAAFTKAMGLDMDLTAALGGVRSKRYSALVVDGTIAKLNVEPAEAPTGLTCSLADGAKAMLAELK
jgi:2-Cys peroxiredoxin 5